MTELVLAMLVFIASHAIPARPAIRNRLVKRLGEGGFVAGYSLMSVALIGWVAHAYAGAPYVPLWPPEPWTRWVPAILMLPACVLLVAGFSQPNPFSLGPGSKGFDPNRPGILRLTRHPVLWSLALWAGAHLPPNGDVAAAVLFGPFLLLALAGPALMERKRRKALGMDAFTALARNTNRPRLAVVGEIGATRLLTALGLYVLLIWLHPHVIGVWPLPFV